MHRLKRVMKALSSQIFKTQQGTTRRDMIPNIREHMLHMREEEEFQKKLETLVKKKARERTKFYSLLSVARESVVFCAFSSSFAHN
jgi:hypothetical protein